MKFAAVLFSVTLLAGCGARSRDEEQVRELIASAEKAAEDRDSSPVLALVAAESSDGNGFDKAHLGNFLRGYFRAHPQLELLVNVESVEFPAEGLAEAVVTVATVELGDPAVEHLKVELRRRDGEWRVVRAERAAR